MKKNISFHEKNCLYMKRPCNNSSVRPLDRHTEGFGGHVSQRLRHDIITVLLHRPFPLVFWLIL